MKTADIALAGNQFGSRWNVALKLLFCMEKSLGHHRDDLLTYLNSREPLFRKDQNYLLKWAILDLFFLYFCLFNTVDSKQMFNKFCRWLDSNWYRKRPLYQLSHNHNHCHRDYLCLLRSSFWACVKDIRRVNNSKSKTTLAQSHFTKV